MLDMLTAAISLIAATLTLWQTLLAAQGASRVRRRTRR